MSAPRAVRADDEHDGLRRRGVGLLVIVVLSVWSAHLALVVAVVPYHHWDELAFGEWSRLIAASGQFRFPSITPLTYQRPLFYLIQGWLWRLLGEDEVLGRLLAVGFLVVLIVSVYRLGGIAPGPWTSRERGGLAVLLLLTVTTVAVGAGAALTDIPVGALVAAAAALLWTTSHGWAASLALAAVAAAAVLVKPTALPALAGLAAAHLVGPWRELPARLRPLLLLSLGTALGLSYSLWMAASLGQSLQQFLQGAILGGYYGDLSHRVRLSHLVNLEWLGPWLRLPLLVSLVYVVTRWSGLPHRASAALALPFAVAGMWAGAWLGAVKGGVALSLAASIGKGWGITMFFTGILAAGSHACAAHTPSRLFLLRQVIWAAPAFASWVIYAPYDMRLLSPVWAPLVLLTTVPVALGLAGWFRIATTVGRLLLIALAVLAASNARMIDGLDVATSMKIARAAGESGRDAAVIRRILVPDVEDVLAALGPRLRPGDRVFSPEGRLRYFFPGRVAQSYPARCEDLAGYRFFVLPQMPAVRAYFITQLKVSPDPDFWGACRSPRLDRIPAEGASAVFEVGEARDSKP